MGVSYGDKQLREQEGSVQPVDAVAREQHSVERGSVAISKVRCFAGKDTRIFFICSKHQMVS